jgi:hypothetical protein
MGPFVFIFQNLMPNTAAAAAGQRDLVEILYPWTKPIKSLPNWSVDGIMADVKYLFSLFMVCIELDLLKSNQGSFGPFPFFFLF